MKRIRLTRPEIEALLSAAGNIDTSALGEEMEDPKERARLIAAYESGMDKLVLMLEQRERTHD